MFLGQPLKHAWRTVRNSKRMLLLVGFADLLICLPPAIYVMSQVHAESAHRVDALELARRYEPDFFFDLKNQVSGFDDTLTRLCIVSFVLFFLLRPLVMGSYTGLAASHRRVHISQFLKDGGAVYWKFLRIAVLAGTAAYLLSLAAKPLLAQVDEWASARTETTSDRYKLVTTLVVFGAFCVVSLVFEYARVGIRITRRPGVLNEIGRSALFILQHPASTLAMFLVSFVIEGAAILGIAWFIQLADAPGGYFTSSAIVLVLVQLVVTLREAARLFHVAGAWQIRATEAGDDRKGPEVIVPETPDSDILRDPLPWNVR